MIVISDTSVITYLIQIGKISLLKELFQDIIIPPSVRKELEKIPNQKYILEQNKWIRTLSIQNNKLLNTLLKKLDKGEAEAIILSIELSADILLIDEKKGRRIADEYGLNITGLLGIFVEGKTYGFINEVKPILDELINKTGFRISPKLYNFVLKIVKENTS